MCMQCVAQGAPMVGVAVTMLNRRNIKTWVSATWRKAHGGAPPAAADEPGPGLRPGSAVETGPAPTSPASSPTSDRVPAGV